MKFKSGWETKALVTLGLAYSVATYGMAISRAMDGSLGAFLLIGYALYVAKAAIDHWYWWED